MQNDRRKHARDEQLKSVLKNSASAVMRVTVHYVHFALIPMETEIL